MTTSSTSSQSSRPKRGAEVGFVLGIACLATCIFLLFNSAGCAVVDTGPMTTRTIGNVASATAGKMIARFNPQRTEVGVDGKISDPRYRVRIFVGSGVLYDMTMSLEGVDLGAEIDADGEGSDVQLPPEVEQQILDVMTNESMSRAEREAAVTRILEAAAARIAASVLTQEGGDQTSQGEETGGESGQQPGS